MLCESLQCCSAVQIVDSLLTSCAPLCEKRYICNTINIKLAFCAVCEFKSMNVFHYDPHFFCSRFVCVLY